MENIEYWAIVADVLVVLILAAAIFVSIWQVKKEINESRVSRNAQLVQDSFRDLELQLEKEREIKTAHDCEIYAINYLNMCFRLVHLKDISVLDESTLLKFIPDFRYALTLLKWYDWVIAEEKGYELPGTWEDIVSWCENKKCRIIPNKYISLPKNILAYPDLLKEDLYYSDEEIKIASKQTVRFKEHMESLGDFEDKTNYSFIHWERKHS